MSTSPETTTHWWKEPMVWLIIALPITAVIAGIVTVAIAARHADTLVQEDFRKEGLALQQLTARDQMAQHLGISAALRFQGDRLSVNLGGRLQPLPERLSLSFVHPTDARQDVKVELAHLGGDLYEGDIGDLGGVGRQVILEPTDNAWRLAGRWSPGQGDTLRLAATTEFSTRP